MDFGLISTITKSFDSKQADTNTEFIKILRRLINDWVKNNKSKVSPTSKNFKSLDVFPFFRHMKDYEYVQPQKIPMTIDIVDKKDALYAVFCCDVYLKSVANGIPNGMIKIHLLGFISSNSETLGYVSRIKTKNGLQIYGNKYQQEILLLPGDFLKDHMTYDSDEINIGLEKLHIGAPSIDESNNLVVKCKNKRKLYIFKQDGITSLDFEYLQANRIDDISYLFLETLIAIESGNTPTGYSNLYSYTKSNLSLNRKRDVTLMRIASHYICLSIYGNTNIVDWYKRAWNNFIRLIFDGEKDIEEKKKVLIYNSIPIDDDRIRLHGIQTYVENIVNQNIDAMCKLHLENKLKLAQNHELSLLSQKIITHIRENAVVNTPISKYTHIGI